MEEVKQVEEKKMDARFIKKLAEMMTLEGIKNLEFSDGVSTIFMERDFSIERTVPVKAPREKKPKVKKDTVLEVRSPVAGKFIKQDLIVGQFVWVDDILCTIDDGQQHNEIASICDGEVTEVFVQNGQQVAFDQLLFKLKAK